MSTDELSRYTTIPETYGTSIYHPGVVTVAFAFNIGRPTNALIVTQWNTAAVGLTVAQLTTVQAAANSAWNANMRNFQATSTNFVGCNVTDMSSNTGNAVNNSGYGAGTPGTGTGTPLTDSVAYLISLKTPTRYKGGHGRMYIPGGNTGSVNSDGRTLTSTVVTNMATSWGAVQTAMSAIAGSAGGPYTQIVWHKKLKVAPNTIEVVGSFVVNSVLASQRRRLRKVPRH